MDAMVLAALKKWPAVPACRGWLGLDRRGDWYMRDDRTQALGPFSVSRGSRIEHEKLREFIARNYAADANGAWYFQNGPQRVYVELEAAPWIWRVSGTPEAPQVVSHTGVAAPVTTAWLDDAGRLFLDTDIGLGLVHAQDMWLAAQVVEAGIWQPADLPFSEFATRFGYMLSPLAAHRDAAV